MTIKKLKEELEASKHPVKKPLHHGVSLEALILGLKKGMILKKHKTSVQSKLIVLEGTLVYTEEDRVLELMQYDEVEIPIQITHSLEAIEDSLCILSQSK